METISEILEACAHIHLTRPGVRRGLDALSIAGDAPITEALEVAISHGGDRQTTVLLCAVAERGIPLSAATIANALRTTSIPTLVGSVVGHVPDGFVTELLEVADDEHLPMAHRAVAARLLAEYASEQDDEDIPPIRRVLWRLETESVGPSPALSFLLTDSQLVLDGDIDPESPIPWLTGSPWSIALPELERHAASDAPLRRAVEKIGRNDPCPCGSGMKYKRCCYEKDRERLSDPSTHAGMTHEELLVQPGATDDPDVIDELMPARLAGIAAGELADSQLIPAFEVLQDHRYFSEAASCLDEATRRTHRVFAFHWQDLLRDSLQHGDTEVATRARGQLDADDLVLPEMFALLEDVARFPEHYDALELIARDTFSDEPDEDPEVWPVLVADALRDRMPGVAAIFARAALVGDLLAEDVQIALQALRRARVNLGHDPDADPAEELVGLLETRHLSEHEAAEQALARAALEDSVSEAQRRHSKARNQLSEAQAELARLRRQLARSREEHEQAVAHDAPADMQTPDVDELRRKFANAKATISQLHEQRQRLRRQLEREQHREDRQSHEGTSVSGPAPAEEAGEETAFTGCILVPDYSETFRNMCKALSPSIVSKALMAVAGFASGSDLIWQHARKLSVPPDHYRVRIGIHYRLIIHWMPGKLIRAVALLTREELDTWIRRQ